MEMEWTQSDMGTLNLQDYLSEWEEEATEKIIWEAEEKEEIENITGKIKMNLKKREKDGEWEITENKKEYIKLTEEEEKEALEELLGKEEEKGIKTAFLTWALIQPSMSEKRNQFKTTPYIFYSRMMAAMIQSEGKQKETTEKISGKEILEIWGKMKAHKN